MTDPKGESPKEDGRPKRINSASPEKSGSGDVVETRFGAGRHDTTAQQAYFDYCRNTFRDYFVQQKRANPGGSTELLAHLDDSDNWNECRVCEQHFADTVAYQQHCRGLMHTQRMLARGQRVGLLPSEPAAASDAERKPSEPDELVAVTTDNRFFCDVCNVACSGDQGMKDHLEGKKHQKTLRMKTQAEQNSFAVGQCVRTESTGEEARIQPTLRTFKEPLIGLEFIVEFVSALTEPRYVCNLCSSKCDKNTLMTHLVGKVHRMAYLKEVRCDMYGEVFQYSYDRSMQNDLLLRKAMEIEKQCGRGLVKQQLEIVSGSSDVQSRGRPGAALLKRPASPYVFASDIPSCTRAADRASQPSASSVSADEAPSSAKKGRADAAPSTASSVAAVAAEGKLNFKALLEALSKAVVQTEEDADFAFQVSNTITKSLLEYRLKQTRSQPSAPKERQTTERTPLANDAPPRRCTRPLLEPFNGTASGHSQPFAARPAAAAAADRPPAIDEPAVFGSGDSHRTPLLQLSASTARMAPSLPTPPPPRSQQTHFAAHANAAPLLTAPDRLPQSIGNQFYRQPTGVPPPNAPLLSLDRHVTAPPFAGRQQASNKLGFGYQ